MSRNPFQADPSKPYEHIGRNGSVIRAERCDLVDGVTIKLGRPDLSQAQLAQDVAEFIGYHAVNILAEFPPGYGFNGYGSVQFEIVS